MLAALAAEAAAGKDSMRKQILADADIEGEAWQAGIQIPAEGSTVPSRKGLKWTKQYVRG